MLANKGTPMTNAQSLLLGAGFVAAALFVAITLVEIFIRPGFSIQRHAISMLSLGERGWLMAAVFIISGLLTLAFALGFWQASGAVFATALLALYGAGLVLAGIFPAPAGMGFPPGTPEDMQPVMDRGATIHSIAFMLAFGSLILASFALGLHYWQAGVVALGVVFLAIGLAIPALIGIGMGGIVPPGIAFYIAAILAWLVIVLAAWRELSL